MSKGLKYCIILFVTTLNLFSEYNFDFSGYIFTIPTYQKLSSAIDFYIPSNTIKKNQYSLFSKIRLRPVYNLWEDARIEVAAETHIDISHFPNLLGAAESIYSRQIYDAEWNIYEEGDFQMSEYIDRFFFKQTFDNFELTLGRQRINWGVGRIWQPTDRFHPMNPADFTKIEKTGADALSFKYFFGLFTDAEFVVNFRNLIKDYNYGVRFRTNFSPFDISLILGYFDKQPNFGFDLSGNISDAGVRAEGIYVRNRDKPDSSYLRLIIGADYQFSSKVYALLEFQYNGEGTTNTEMYDFTKMLSGEIMNLGSIYLASRVNIELHPLLILSLNLMQNINDGSGYISPFLMWNALDNLSINAGAMLAYGSKKAEYWYYPKTSIYLTGQLFF